MTDKRSPLPHGFSLICGGTAYTIDCEIGRGSTCIVYGGRYRDSENMTHFVRIKELYPYDMDISRDPESRLVPHDAAGFSLREQDFISAYKRSTELKSTLGLTNSTVNPLGIFTACGTRYIMTDCIEGADSGNASLNSVFRRTLALAKIIGKYHENGFLHLDIKPQNILLIPETDEHIYLFDFDSMLKKSDIVSGNAEKLSFSDGFSAPELVRGEMKKVGDTADIFSEGAVLFYSIFGRKPTISDRRAGADYDLSSTDIKNFSPDLADALTEVLRKTLSSSPALRYKTDSEFIAALEELVRLSDEKKPYINDNFSYNSANFVGRENELSLLYDALNTHHSVFLSGIGGIGKTELARHFAHIHRKAIGHIMFVPFSGDLVSTVCGSDLDIGNFERGKNETESELFGRKLSALRSAADENDLFILDNFDTDDMSGLMELLECPCRFIITTRNDFRDYDLFQLDIGGFSDKESIMELFGIYDPLTYDEYESGYIEKIIELVERHTMTVELIAKYLRISNELPSVLFGRLSENEGVAGTGGGDVRQRKDRTLRSAAVSAHLSALFDLSAFTESQREVIGSLSLLGYVRIRKDVFERLCPIESCDEDISRLIKSGWIRLDAKNGRISLHQVILDLVYTKLSPNAETCPHITDGMLSYLKRESESQLDRDVKRNISKLFMQRISGCGLAYAELAAVFCEKISNREYLLDNAENICISHGGSAAAELIFRIYLLRLELCEKNDDLLFYEADEYSAFTERVTSYAQKAFSAAEEYANDDAYLTDACLQIADILSGIAETFFMSDDKCKADILRCAKGYINKAEEYLSENIPKKKREEFYRRLADFYSYDDLFHEVRSEMFADPQKSGQYNRAADDLKENNCIGIPIINETTYEDMGDEARQRGRFHKAIRYYRKQKTTPVYFGVICEKIAECYIAASNYKKAEAECRKAVDTDPPDLSVCTLLLRILYRDGRYAEYAEYAEKMLDECSKTKDIYTESAVIQYTLYGCYCLYRTSGNDTESNERWKKCLDIFRETEKLPSLMEFLEEPLTEYAEKEKHGRDKPLFLLDCARRMYSYSDNCVLFENVIEMCEDNAVYADIAITAILEYAQHLLMSDKKRTEKMCRKAEDIFFSECSGNLPLRDKMYCLIGDCLFSAFDPKKAADAYRKSNIFAYTERECSEKIPEEQFALWKDAADKYRCAEMPEMSEKCLDMALNVLRPLINKEEFAQWDNISSFFTSFMTETQDHAKRKQLAYEAVPYALDYFEHNRDDSNSINHDRFDAVNSLAGYMQTDGAESDAAILNVMSAAAAAGADITPSDAKAFLSGRKLPELLDIFRASLSYPLDAAQTDDIIEAWHSFSDNTESAHVLPEFAEIFAEFSERYEKAEVEFRK